MIKVSIIIPHYNNQDILISCIDSLQKLDYANYEIIVVNNNSTYMFSARSNKVDNKNYSGAYLLSNSFLSLKKLNINFVDLEGINSPQRGFYKLGFGGDIKTYYNIKLTKWY